MRTVLYLVCLSIHINVCNLILGATSLWTWLLALHLCAGRFKLPHRPRYQTTGNESEILARINVAAHKHEDSPMTLAPFQSDPSWLRSLRGALHAQGVEGITRPATVHNRTWAPSVQPPSHHNDVRVSGRRETQSAPRGTHPKSVPTEIPSPRQQRRQDVHDPDS